MIQKNPSFYTVVLLIFIAIGLTACRKDQKKVVTENKQDYVNMPLAFGDKHDSAMFDEDVEAFVLEEESIASPFDHSPENDIRLAYNQPEATVEDFTFEQLDTKDEMNTIYFSYDSKEPSKDQRENLRKVAQKAQELYQEGRVVCCKGHSCKWHGTSAYNVALSMNRANTVASYLENEAGIPRERIKIFGVGNEEPVALENSKEGQAPNRRVEVYALAA
jgi:outer membrane protein OmpA-like peptidoglycan-associated protein